jgi:uncharacterized protein with von Willebrand factor type A (vWA) domain
MTRADLPKFLWEVTRQLRRRRLQLGVGDYDALRRALTAGFGLSSYEELRRLCVTLWAKSPEEAEIVLAAFTRSDLEDWRLPEPTRSEGVAESKPSEAPDRSGHVDDRLPSDNHETEGDSPQTKPITDLATSPPSTGAVDRSLVLVAQYPLTEREIAQAWRRLRRPLRVGPAVEIDIPATIEQRSRHAVATPPVLVPRRRNTAKLLLMIDRYGSMTPFHGYVGHVSRAIRNAGRIDDVREVYYHDLPGSAANRSVLEQVEDPFRPDLDLVLPLIQPMGDGRVYDDSELTLSRPLTAILDELVEDTATVVISDAGAARQQFDITRLLDTVALLKALYSRVGTIAWLNPVQPENWLHTTAAQVARYVPMYSLTREGLDRAVDTLRGRPAPVERPL